jgi:hypothetical protein
MRRSRLVLVILLLALLAGGYAGAWFYVAGQVRGALQDWAEARRVEGYTVGWDRYAISGFPGRVHVVIEKPVYGKAAATPGYEARAPVLVGEAWPWAPQRWHVTVPQGARLAVEPAASRSAMTAQLEAADIRVEPREADATAPRGIAVAVVADRVGIDADVHVAIGHVEAETVLPSHAVAGHLETWLAGRVRLVELHLPVPVPPLGDIVDEIALRLRVKGTIPGGPRREALAAWRQDGGTVEIDDLTVAWARLHAAATGTLALDEALQPEGALTATISGYAEIIDALVLEGTMKTGDAALAKLALGLLAKPGAGGASEITAPVTAQSGRLFIGPARIARLPNFTWE